jgi:hypothetical protein
LWISLDFVFLQSSVAEKSAGNERFPLAAMANVIERVNCSGASEQWVAQELSGFLQLAQTVIF